MAEYERVNGDTILTQRRIAGGPVLTFQARGVRKERTGVHAEVSILANLALLAWNNQNVERDEDRVRLANSAYRQLTADLNGTADSVRQDYSNADLKHDLDVFCRGLWDQHNEVFDPIAVEGTDPQPPRYVLDPYIVEEGGTLIFAPPGRGKSYITLALAVCLDAGIATSAWRIPERRPCLLLNLERSAVSVASRLGAINRALGLPTGRHLDMIQARGHTLAEVHTRARRWVVGHPGGVVFVDSLSRAGAGDLNENQAGNNIIDLLNALGTWLAIAHTSRKDETHVFGSQMFDAGADLLVMVRSQQDEAGPLGVGLSLEKHNDTPFAPLAILAFEFCDTGLTGIRKARRGEFPDIEAGKEPRLRDLVRAYLLDVGKATGTEVARELGVDRSMVANLLSQDNTFLRLERTGREVFYGVRGDA